MTSAPRKATSAEAEITYAAAASSPTLLATVATPSNTASSTRGTWGFRKAVSRRKAFTLAPVRRRLPGSRRGHWPGSGPDACPSRAAGHPLGDDTKQDEDVGDHDGREELEEVLDPQVHDHEPPVVRRREAGVGPGQQADGVEGGDGQGREEEHPGHVAQALVTEAPAHRPEEHDHPEEEPDGEQDLPEAPEVEVLVALVAEPGPQSAHPTVDASELADQAPEHHDGQGTEQPVGQPPLAPWLAAGDHRCQKDAGGEKRGRRPEDGELHVPGPDHVEGQDSGK